MKTNHYVAVGDRSHLRIYLNYQDVGQTTPGLRPVYAVDFAARRAGFAERSADDLALRINEFFRSREGYSWDLAIAHPLLPEVLARLQTSPRARLRHIADKELLKERPERLSEHFVDAESAHAIA